MDKIKLLIRLEKYNFYKLICNPKCYIVFLITFFFLEIIYGGIGDYLAANNDTVHIFELYIFSVFSKNVYVCFFIGCIVLFCDAPFADKDTMQRVMRTKKSCWITAQIVYVIIVSVIYQLFIELCFVIVSNGRVTALGQWSDTIWKGIQFSPENIGILPVVDFFYGITQNGGPGKVFVLSFILSVCLSVFFAMVFMAFNLFKRSYTSFVIVLMLWFGDFIYGYMNILPPVFEYILPFWMCQNALVKGGMEWMVSVGVLCIYVMILSLLSIKFIKHYDFSEMEKCR